VLSDLGNRLVNDNLLAADEEATGKGRIRGYPDNLAIISTKRGVSS
jgi:hypothetical protein